MRGKAYVHDLRNEFEFKSEVTRRAWNEFNKQGIMAPETGMLGGGGQGG